MVSRACKNPFFNQNVAHFSPMYVIFIEIFAQPCKERFSKQPTNVAPELPMSVSLLFKRKLHWLHWAFCPGRFASCDILSPILHSLSPAILLSPQPKSGIAEAEREPREPWDKAFFCYTRWVATKWRLAADLGSLTKTNRRASFYTSKLSWGINTPRSSCIH